MHDQNYLLKNCIQYTPCEPLCYFNTIVLLFYGIFIKTMFQRSGPHQLIKMKSSVEQTALHFLSKFLPVYAAEHLHLYMPTKFEQEPPFKHGEDAHSSISKLHCFPVKPFLQLHKYVSVCSTHVLLFLQGLLRQNRS